MTLFLSLVIGFVNGARTFAPAAVAAWAAWLGWLALGATPLAFLGSPWAVAVLTVLAIVEKVADKHPDVPHRVTPAALAFRLAAAAIAVGAIAAPSGPMVPGMIAGAAAAVPGAFATYRLRARAAAAFGGDLHAALIEDAVVIAVACAAVAAAA